MKKLYDCWIRGRIQVEVDSLEDLDDAVYNAVEGVIADEEIVDYEEITEEYND